jgi:catechol 2,3-dioxygenase-like lactoylglutathione lyase family enzyme
MRALNYLLLAVASPAKSAEFYTKLLGVEPVENSPTFVLYVLPNGIKIGLWIKDEIEPRPKAAGGVEISFTEESKDAVLATYAAWKALGAKVVQEPTQMDFGFTFVVEDLDGHRLRPFVLADQPR